MKKIIALFLVTLLCLNVVSFAEDTIKYKRLTFDQGEAISPATMEANRIQVYYAGGVRGEGGAKFKFNSDIDGFKKICISYDHAHKTNEPVKMLLYVNLPDDNTTDGTVVELTNIANGAWGRYNTDYVIIPVKKGANTLRIASNQGSAGWQFYIDYIEFSEKTYKSKAEMPRTYIEAPRPSDIWDKIEFEILENNDEAKIVDASEGGKAILSSSISNVWSYQEMDFKDGLAKSVNVRFQGKGLIVNLDFMIDKPDSEPIAKIALIPSKGNPWENKSTNLKTKISGKHKIFVRINSGDALLNYFQFSKDESSSKVYTKTPTGLYRDTYSDTWSATDNLGRETPVFDEVGSPKDKLVGMFYFLWHDKTNGELFDHYKTYLEGGVDAVWKMIPQGPMGYQHYWAKPYLGYYRSDDEWVIRKHAQQLVNLGVDFIFFDCSNKNSYPLIVRKILETYMQIRSEGGKTPQIVYFFGDNEEWAPDMVKQVYNDHYMSGEFDELWFHWQGKPLVIGNKTKITDKVLLDKFTYRRSWAFNSWTGDGIEKWPWIADYPQAPGKDANGNIEQVVVASGRHANNGNGRSYTLETGQPTDGKEAFEFELMKTTTPLGLMYNEQWSRAYELDPPVVMLTGWNEWWAGRWEDMANGQLIANTYKCIAGNDIYKHYYVDCFNPEFSRDIEAMEGGFNDNYYYQTVQNMRKFKGARPVPAATGLKTIDINGSFDQYNSVFPEYMDTLYDTTKRNSPANAGSETYVNNTGRNDISIAKVSHDDAFWYFYVETKEPITKAEGANWMNLYINTDMNGFTGWNGYDIIINRSQDAKTVSVESNVGDKWSWKKLGTAEYRVEGNYMQIKVPTSYLNINTKVGFEFKWADNSVLDGNIMQFMDKGDAAPDERFNFKYTEVQKQVELSSELKAQLGVAMVLNKNTAFTSQGTVKIDATNSKVTPFINEGRTLVPVRFLSESIGAQVSYDDATRLITISKDGMNIKLTMGNNVMTVNGVDKTLDVTVQSFGGRTFLPLRAIVEALGKTITWDERGLIFIGDKTVNTTIINECLRKL